MSASRVDRETASPSSSATPPRWIPLAGAIVGIVGLLIVVIGFLFAVGGWRTGVDNKLAELDKRMGKAERNQETYIPILVGMTKDVSYLAERAHRQDDREQR